MQLKVKKPQGSFVIITLSTKKHNFMRNIGVGVHGFQKKEIMQDIKQILEELYHEVFIEQVILKQDTNIVSLVSNKVIQSSEFSFK